MLCDCDAFIEDRLNSCCGSRSSKSRQTKPNIPPIFSGVGMLKQSGREVPSVTKNVLWQQLYTAAMLELDHANLPCRIEAAQVAIGKAMAELANSRQDGVREEMQALADALRNLQTLHRVELLQPMPAASQGQRLAEG
jgi:hypothetical protein